MANIIHFATLFLVFCTTFAQDNYRLSTTVRPSHYEVELTLFPGFGPSASFSGSVQITLSTSASVSEFEVQSSSLTYSNIHLYDVADATQANLTDSYSENATYDKLTIRTSTDLAVGRTYILSATYTGILHDDMNGFYRSSYRDTNRTTRWLATTQFQPTYARRALPCFDEPSFKATFNISIIHPQDVHAIGNTPIISSETYDPTLGLNKTTFQQTPIMSTYLVAFVVSDFTGLTNTSVNYGVYAAPHLSNTLQYAFDVGPRLLTEMGNFINYPYLNSGIGKLDQVAIPDFSAGAMENWGLITYRESRLLFDQQESTFYSRKSIASVIMHEIAHMWFGDLVTCDWWSYTWLNEGFARYFQYFGTAWVETEMELDKQFVVEQLQAVFASDASTSSAALNSGCSSPGQISGKFGTISYNKGSSIIRMVRYFLGYNNWRSGLIDYISARQFSTGIPDQLYSAWSNYAQSLPSGLSLSTILRSWTDVGGFPLVKVSLSGNDAVITQQQFLLNSSQSSNREWYVPLTYTTSHERNFDNTTASYWLRPGQNVTIPNILHGGSGWVLLNLQQIGYYRVTYDDELWSQLARGLQEDNFDGIPDLNRAQIVDDVLTLARARQLSYLDAFNTISFLAKDTSYYPWYSAFTSFSYLRRRYQTHATLGSLFRAHLLEVMDSVYNSVSFARNSSESYIEVQKKELALQWACNLGHTECIQRAQDLYRSLRNNNRAVNPDIRSVVYCTALRYSNDSSDWYFLWNKLTQETLATEISLIITALGCSRNETLLDEYMTRALDSSAGLIRRQDITSVFSSVYGNNPEGIEIALNYVQNNYQSFIDYFRAPTKNYCFDSIIIANLSGNFLFLVNMVHIVHFATIFLVVCTTRALDLYRLGPTVTPTHYDVELTLLPGFGPAASFSGRVEITLETIALVTLFDLHASSLTFNSIRIYNTDDPAQTNIFRSYSKNATFGDKLWIRTTTDLVVGETYILVADYTGILHDDMNGFYRSSYRDTNGSTRWLATTQFEPTYARRAFPCFDEPNLKTTFRISIIHPEDVHALSNTPIVSTQIYNQTLGLTRTTFQQTPTMSTYLIAFVVSDFTGLTNTSINYGVYAPPHLINTTQYAFDIGPKLLTEMGNFINHSYLDSGIGKLDQVAIPDFSAGAMENWGLITYRQGLLLYDEEESTLSRKRSIATTIMHEIAHMWFGNLVTCDWWSFAWLNEGFARYFQYFGTAWVETEMELDKIFVVEQLQTALANDASASSPPLSSNCSSPSEIEDKFSTITYDKGASIIRMAKHFLGYDNWRSGLIDYISTYQYATGTARQLFARWTNGTLPSRLSVAAILLSWTDLGGFPVVKVSLSGNDVVITQKQFLLNSSQTSRDEYYVPITYTTSLERNFNNTTPSYWLVPRENLTISNILQGRSGWVLVNLQQTGYYRVTYDNELWSQLAQGLQRDNFDGIPDLNRAQIVDDVLTLARARQLTYSSALNTIAFLSNDTSYYPWYSAFTSFSYLKRRFQTHATLGTTLRDYLLEIMDSLYNNVSFTRNPSESYVDVQKKELALQWACNLGHSDCIEQAQDLYRSLRSNNIAVNPDVRTVVYCTALRYSNDSGDWYFLWNKLTRETLASEIILIINSLGCSKNETLLDEYITQTLNTSAGIIRNQDIGSALASVSGSNPEGIEIAFNYVKNNYQFLIDYSNDTSTVLSILSNIAGRMTNETQIQKLESWISENSNSLSAISSSVQSYIRSARNNLVWDRETAVQLNNFYFSNSSSFYSSS
ncbi:membrane alanyl aminopeptidase-like [Agrilus planipennis]|uniref:Aminopeptidase N n=1 Tax=Agrilus planipennis TaxID=224129 RepID=A0A7F5R7Y3_AGRPL|nr:membrane alanyl aminopeptidase-like [Agrilus planipennis]